LDEDEQTAQDCDNALSSTVDLGYGVDVVLHAS
jgi:hypothetical protein